MAITSSITISVRSTDLPSGYTPPTVAELANPNSEDVYVNINSADVEDPDGPTAVAALLAALKTEIDTTVIPSTLGLDADDTITARIDVKNVQRRWTNYDPNDASDVESQYLTSTDILRCRCRITWLVSA